MNVVMNHLGKMNKYFSVSGDSSNCSLLSFIIHYDSRSQRGGSQPTTGTGSKAFLLKGCGPGLLCDDAAAMAALSLLI